MSLFGLFCFPVGWPKGDSRDLTTIYPHFWGVSASEASPVTNLWLAHFGCRKVGKPQLVVYENPSNATWMGNHGTSSVGYRFHCNPMVAIDPNHPILEFTFLDFICVFSCFFLHFNFDVLWTPHLNPFKTLVIRITRFSPQDTLPKDLRLDTGGLWRAETHATKKTGVKITLPRLWVLFFDNQHRKEAKYSCVCFFAHVCVYHIDAISSSFRTVINSIWIEKSHPHSYKCVYVHPSLGES